jgi:site-specific DNA-methyltransferase (adenine-specific)
MKPYYEKDNITLYCGDNREVLPTLPEASVDFVCTDPPYGLGFMGHEWDHGVPGVPYWKAIQRVCKPGALMLAFGGTRTCHRLA